MTKSELAKKVAGKLEWKQRQAALALDSLIISIVEGLKEEGRVQIPGFGVFTLRQYKARQARNPRTGETVEVPARKNVSFKPSMTLKKHLNEVGDE